jgi:hypothetical protein
MPMYSTDWTGSETRTRSSLRVVLAQNKRLANNHLIMAMLPNPNITVSPHRCRISVGTKFLERARAGCSAMMVFSKQVRPSKVVL